MLFTLMKILLKERKNKMWFKIKDYFYYLCEHGGSKISNWAWHKRWNRKNRKGYKDG